MRIAHLVWSFTTGGIETMLIDIVNEQVKSCDVSIFVINDKYDVDLIEQIDKRVHVSIINRHPGDKSPLPLFSLNFKLLLYRPDIVHCHQGNLGKIVWTFAKKMLTVHNTHSSTEGYSRFHGIFCISKTVQEYTAKQGFPNGIVVYNGIHSELIKTKDKLVNSLRGTIRMICVGRLHRDKGQRLVIEAFNELVNVHQLTSISMDFIGDGNDREVLELLTNEYNLYRYIHFLGCKPRNWVYSHLKDYDLFVLPSISEGFGLTLAEACAAMLPTLTCDLPGPLEVIDNGRLGMSFKTGDPISLANKIGFLLQNGYESHIIKEAYRYVKDNFDVSVTAKKYIQTYRLFLR